MNNSPIKKVFVLMLENRSFDHMLGFSGISGTDAQTGQPTTINGLTGKEFNSYDNQDYLVTQPADYVMPVDPGHEFPDVVEQLAGEGATYPFGGTYPTVNNSGFVASYVAASAGSGTNSPGEIMKCYSASQLPVLNALAKDFAVCDNWFAAMPGPTWPNRFFLHAASSGGLDHSPTTVEIAKWVASLGNGFDFPNGTIFDRIGNDSSLFGWRIYRGASSPKVGSIPIAAGMNGISLADTVYYDQFAQDIASASYPWEYTFIEPNYGDVTDNTYSGGTSQHPMDNVTNGEALIKATYEALRNSQFWEESLLIITWDEHGGFYDHVAPSATVAPGDTSPGSAYNQYGFTFEQYGPRVPAVIVSPYIQANIIDHRAYDHSSVPATLEELFGLQPLTQRDAAANSVLSLVTLDQPRTDTPTKLPEPAAAPDAVRRKAPNLSESINSGNLPGFLGIVQKSLRELLPQDTIQEEHFTELTTRKEAYDFILSSLERIDEELDARKNKGK